MENVEIIIPKSGVVNRHYTQMIVNHGSLGRELKITPKAHLCINAPGLKHEYFVETVSCLIGIGKDHTAELIMTKESWEAFKNGESINIDTLKGFKKKFL